MNIIEKLVDFKKGMKLYSPQLGELVFDGIVDNEIITKSSWGAYFQFDKNGRCYLPDGTIPELHPSKDNNCWDNIKKRGPFGSTYYYVTTLGYVLPSIDCNSNNDNAMFSCGNYFLTENEALASNLYHAYSRNKN
jgi:hypothetical protein